jgi:hypothetical protein
VVLSDLFPIPIGTHCGLTVDSSDPNLEPLVGGPAWVDGQVTAKNCLKIYGPLQPPDPPRPGQVQSPMAAFPLDTCTCIAKYMKYWNTTSKCRSYEKGTTNSNFALRCLATACGIEISWKGKPPVGWDCQIPLCFPVGASTPCPCPGDVKPPGYYPPTKY